MRRVRFHPDAARELEETISWYESRAPGLRAQFLQEVERGITVIQEHPQAWSPFLNETRRFHTHRFPYGLVYAEDEEAIHILAVMHLHRKPDYWQHRQPPADTDA